MRKQKGEENSCCGRQHSIGSIIIDLELDHFDYYTLVGSASLVGCCDLTVDFVGRRAMDHFVVHRDRLAVGCFLQRWHRLDAAEKRRKKEF
jgi:hypothetical protein